VDVHGVLDGVQRLGVADDPFDVRARRLFQQRQGQFEDRLGGVAALVLGVDDPVQAVRNVGHQERERDGPAGRALADGVQERRGRRRAMGDDEDAGGHGGLHKTGTPLLA
jgi:hypothetical protein